MNLLETSLFISIFFTGSGILQQEFSHLKSFQEANLCDLAEISVCVWCNLRINITNVKEMF
jgi:hypothetical protein